MKIVDTEKEEMADKNEEEQVDKNKEEVVVEVVRIEEEEVVQKVVKTVKLMVVEVTRNHNSFMVLPTMLITFKYIR